MPEEDVLKPVGIVNPLEGGLAPGTQPAPIDGVAGFPSALVIRPSRCRMCMPHPAGHSRQVVATVLPDDR